MADTPFASEIAKPIISAPLPFSTKLRFTIRLWLLKTFVTFALRLLELVRRYRSPASKLPTYLKTYPEFPRIANRVFVPTTWKSGDKPLPLFIDVHGGGFCFGAPMTDDSDNVILRDHGFLVISIGYVTAPSQQCPEMSHSVAKMIQLVLDDSSLPYDKTKVILGGYSAGGNLSFSAVQLNGLHDRIQTLVAYYPPTDFRRTLAKRLTYISEDDRKAGKKDYLEPMSLLFNYGYVKQGQDRREPLLSVILAERNKLPKSISITGCGEDMLCQEAEDMAYVLADSEPGEMDLLREDKSEWRKGRVRWERLLGTKHGFNQQPGKTERDLETQRRMHDNVVKWIHEVAWN